MQQQVGKAGLLQGCAEGVHHLVGELADEAHRVGQEVWASVDAHHAGGGVERVEEAVAHPHLRAREGVQECALARVRVPGERDARERRALALGAHHRAGALHVLQATAQRGDAVAGEAAVGLDLGLPRSPRADPAAEALQVAPQAPHAREVVLELGELHLELSLSGWRRGWRRCRGSPWCGPPPASRAPPRGCAPGGR